MSKIGESRLDQWKDKSASEKLADEIEGITDNAFEYIIEEGGSELCQKFFDENLNRQFPVLRDVFLNAICSHFESSIQKEISKESDCHWGKLFPSSYLRYQELQRKQCESAKIESVMSVLAKAVIDGSKEIGKIISQ